MPYPDPHDIVEECYHELDGLMVLMQENQDLHFLTGDHMYFLLRPIRDQLDRLRQELETPPPSTAGAAAVVPFNHYRC